MGLLADTNEIMYMSKRVTQLRDENDRLRDRVEVLAKSNNEQYQARQALEDELSIAHQSLEEAKDRAIGYEEADLACKNALLVCAQWERKAKYLECVLMKHGIAY